MSRGLGDVYKRQAVQDVREGKNLHGPFNSLSELMEDLNADD